MTYNVMEGKGGGNGLTPYYAILLIHHLMDLNRI